MNNDNLTIQKETKANHQARLEFAKKDETRKKEIAEWDEIQAQDEA